MRRFLIIKLGARGDVLRTTSLLRAIKGSVWWVTSRECMPLLSVARNLKRIIDIDSAEEELKGEYFDSVICLDEERPAARLAGIIGKGKLTGSFIDARGSVSYTDSSRELFDMGLISKLGRAKADELKRRNTRSYQEIIFKMTGNKFNGQEYVLNTDGRSLRRSNKITVGIERRADARWPSKKWDKFGLLGQRLLSHGVGVMFFKQRKTVRQYIKDISRCDLVVTGDTLALHIALALKLKVVAIFTCTSPGEIYGYSRLIKVVSPALDEAFYSKRYVKEASAAVSLESVYGAVMKMLGKSYAG